MDSAWYMMRQLGGCQHIRSCGYSLHNMIRNDAARMLRHERLLLRRSVDAQRQDMMDAQAAAMERYS